MKAKLITMIALSAASVTTATAVTCAIVFNNTAQTDNAKNDEIYAVYTTYVAYAEENGTTPLSYEEWLSSIKGEKGVPDIHRYGPSVQRHILSGVRAAVDRGERHRRSPDGKRK